MKISAIICTHNPRPDCLGRVLDALSRQTLSASEFEVIVVDNASTHGPEELLRSQPRRPVDLRVVTESRLGLTFARKRGLRAARAPVAVFVDDDNILAADYLENVDRDFTRYPRVGVAAGRICAEFARPLEAGLAEFAPLIGDRNFGDEVRIAESLHPADRKEETLPEFVPAGAGMALRQEAWPAWLDRRGPDLSDRKGGDLSSCGDFDIVWALLRAGWSAAYFPGWVLTHVITDARMDCRYLARLNHGIQKSWMQLLNAYAANPWPPLTPLGVKLRCAKAWLTSQAWKSPAHHIRWRGLCGHFEGRLTRPTK